MNLACCCCKSSSCDSYLIAGESAGFFGAQISGKLVSHQENLCCNSNLGVKWVLAHCKVPCRKSVQTSMHFLEMAAWMEAWKMC